MAKEPSEATDLALVEMAIGRLKLVVYLLALAFFLDRCCCRTVSMELIEFIVASDC